MPGGVVLYVIWIPLVFLNDPVFRGSGLIARFLYCFPVSNIGTRKYDTQAVPEAVIENYKNLTYKMLQDKFTFHSDIQALFDIGIICEEVEKSTLHPENYPSSVTHRLSIPNCSPVYVIDLKNLFNHNYPAYDRRDFFMKDRLIIAFPPH